MDIIYKNGRNDVCLLFESPLNIEKIYDHISNLEGISQNDFYLTFNGKYPQSNYTITSSCTVRFHLRVPGGKGGFGSMLRAIGARIEKTTNHEACRDLSGRRMRDVNHEKAIGEWLKQKENDEEDRKGKRVKKLEKILNPKHNYEDKDYTSKLQSNAEKIDEALKTALQKRDKKFGSKRKIQNEVDARKEKKNRMWIGVSDDESDESEDEREQIVSLGEDGPCCSKSTVGNFDDTSINCEDENCEVTQITEKDNVVDNLRTVSDTSNIGSCVENSIPNNSNDVSMDSKSIITIKHTTDPKEESVSETIAAPNDTESNLTNVTETDIVVDPDKVTDVVHTTSKDEPINLGDFESPEHLENVGLERLKTSLMSIGLKCGGTLQERAKRLYLTKDTPLEKLDRSLFAKPAKTKNKK